jgi:hypothetical protein
VERAKPAEACSWRAARSTGVCLAAVGTSLAGHALGGGAVPSPLPLTAFTLVLAALTTALGGVRWTPARLVGALAVAQGGFHLVFQGMSGAHGAGADLRMLAWHLAATTVTCALVLRAEAWLGWAVHGLAGRRLAPAPPRALRPAPLSARVETPHSPALDRALPRRGPPLSAAA